MPEPNRMPWIVDEAVVGVSIERLIEERAVIVLTCHGCWRDALWQAPELRRHFLGRLGLTFERIAPMLRCSECRSEWLQVVRLYGSAAAAAIERHANRQIPEPISP
jgi:hypothetical protein